MAATTDLLTLDEAKMALNIVLAETVFDTEVASYVTAVSQRLDDMCGPIVKRTVTGEVHDGGSGTIWPNFAPILSVSAVTEYLSGIATTLTAESLTVAGDYILADAATPNARILRRSSWNGRLFTAGAGNVVLTYIAGRFDTTALVSPKFKQAAAKTLSWLWKGDQGAGTTTFGGVDDAGLFGLGFALPNVVVEMLAYERRAPVVA